MRSARAALASPSAWGITVPRSWLLEIQARGVERIQLGVGRASRRRYRARRGPQDDGHDRPGARPRADTRDDADTRCLEGRARPGAGSPPARHSEAARGARAVASEATLRCAFCRRLGRSLRAFQSSAADARAIASVTPSFGASSSAWGSSAKSASGTPRRSRRTQSSSKVVHFEGMVFPDSLATITSRRTSSSGGTRASTFATRLFRTMNVDSAQSSATTPFRLPFDGDFRSQCVRKQTMGPETSGPVPQSRSGPALNGGNVATRLPRPCSARQSGT
ncbi:hypothetical protein BH11MYX4_BH11MYX4_18560 [soil metagenome]